MIHGGLTPRERKQQMKRIRNLDFQYVIASDLASRGIDIEGVSHVVNFDVPNDIDFFTHRVGRTGRGNYKGVAITLYSRMKNIIFLLLKIKAITLIMLILKWRT